ncbi:hypothetical protein [Nibribacter koreensis]|uniref:SRPBCC family protein n=1 Tax=Nibribacter koreensis TaxID=1084519 RepID=A0ABP8FU74_9BACT
MKVLNIHKREINQPKHEVAKLFNTLASENDMMLATDKWSPLILDKGLQVGSKGGHGPIKYSVTNYQEGDSITFRFDLKGFDGCHTFALTEITPDKTELSHVIDMTTSGAATIKWAVAIRWMHDAFMEDAFDKVENHFTEDKKHSNWNWWVRTLRKAMKPRKKQAEG